MIFNNKMQNLLKGKKNLQCKIKICVDIRQINYKKYTDFEGLQPKLANLNQLTMTARNW